MGTLAESGIGTPIDTDVPQRSVGALRAGIPASNRRLLQSLSEDKHALQLHQLTLKDAEMGRMSTPKVVEPTDSVQHLLAPRFSAEQLKEDNSLKLRPIDHFSWSAEGRFKRTMKPCSVNGHTSAREKLRHDSLDKLWHTMRIFVELVGDAPGLFKVDVDSAFRRVPLQPDHQWAGGIAYKMDGKVAQLLARLCS